jgi:hypothetical protein
MTWDEKSFWLRFWWAVVFLGSYVYCIATYGFQYGGGLGWLLSGVAATAAVALWTFVWHIFGDALWLLIILGIVTAVIYAFTGAWPPFG